MSKTYNVYVPAQLLIGIQAPSEEEAKDRVAEIIESGDLVDYGVHVDVDEELFLSRAHVSLLDTEPGARELWKIEDIDVPNNIDF